MATSRVCLIADCGKPSRGSHGLCNAHRLLLQRHGRLERTQANGGEPLAFAEAALKMETADCIEWPYGRGKPGYPILTVDGKSVAGHRYICLRSHGPAPQGREYALHRCGNRGCVNPAHIEWGSNTDNYWDMVRHGRRNNTVLTEAMVAEIKRSPHVRSKDLAKQYGVSQSTIINIRNGKNWGHVVISEAVSPSSPPTTERSHQSS